ncbi:lysozyme inhibitor LprI family protein [Bacillus sp. FJAT-50079]|uniref:lysozyme inhibitor LprI family protein n=1 Tax=Bacillus sp. FJAT-50079 TaxID=2833577 RepID=UPI001BC9F271|nr:lysozyme inhibitor LprI family protein [Bacillus sp. FJAT-50079]MBS4209401.1 DUF1311 domain-containing protein [Bacillus sp. FJAT-50079]
MKINNKILIVIFTVLLAACGNSDVDNQSQNPNDNSSNAEPPETASSTDNTNSDIMETNNNSNEKSDTSDAPAKDEDATTAHNSASLKEEYLQKLNTTKKEMDEIQKNSEAAITYEMKKVEGDRYDVWDELLNEIYGVLKDQLSTDEMEQLREEQRNWINNRDAAAKEASLKYEGGTMEQLEYVTVLANLTEERCYELVEVYI